LERALYITEDTSYKRREGAYASTSPKTIFYFKRLASSLHGSPGNPHFTTTLASTTALRIVVDPPLSI
ncbi:MAG: hypothetical protein QXH01_07925, partial [Thermofilum sp.]